MTRTKTAVALLLLLALLAGCGGGEEEELVAEDDVRACLTDAGLGIERPGLSPNPALGSAAPDFRALGEEGLAVDVVVFGSADKAERAAADVRSALAGFGAGDAEVVFERNALAVYDQAPTAGDRRAVEDCLQDARVPA